MISTTVLSFLRVNTIVDPDFEPGKKISFCQARPLPRSRSFTSAPAPVVPDLSFISRQKASILGTSHTTLQAAAPTWAGCLFFVVVNLCISAINRKALKIMSYYTMLALCAFGSTLLTALKLDGRIGISWRAKAYRLIENTTKILEIATILQSKSLPVEITASQGRDFSDLKLRSVISRCPADRHFTFLPLEAMLLVVIFVNASQRAYRNLHGVSVEQRGTVSLIRTDTSLCFW